jgi:enoyl-CoA hydratase
MSVVEVEQRGPVLRIFLNRPESHNAQNEELIHAMQDAFRSVSERDDVRVVVLAGRGKSFSSGHDLKRTIAGEIEQDIAELRSTTEGRLQHELGSYYGPCMTIKNCPVPTIAQVHGHCIAAGLMVAAMCDLIVAGESARFSNPVLRMGAVATEVLVEPWEIGLRKAKELLFTGDVLDAEQARALGMVNRVVPDAELTAHVDDLADRIATVPPVAMRLMKESLNRTADAMGQQAAWQQHFMIHQVGHATDEYQRIITNPRPLKDFLADRDRAHEGRASD